MRTRAGASPDAVAHIDASVRSPPGPGAGLDTTLRERSWSSAPKRAPYVAAGAEEWVSIQVIYYPDLDIVFAVKEVSGD